MPKNFGVRQLRFVRSPTAREGQPAKAALPRSRASDTLAIVLIICLTGCLQSVAGQRRSIATITIDTSKTINQFSPSHALGAAIDGHEQGINDLQLKPDNIKVMLSAGLQPLTYRLRSELGIDVWHWNPAGAWSDQNNRQGYWASDANLGQPISLSYGYSLPRRGNTVDQAANNGYSRLDDGDELSFWKSNPYLDSHFTGENDAQHPQWIVIQLAQPEPVNAIRIVWGEPFAKRFRIQFGNFDDASVIALSPPGTWSDFPSGVLEGSADKTRVLRLSQKPIRASLIRILMTESSGDVRTAKGDIRDAVGFAVRELYVGLIDTQGVFHDRLRHGRTRAGQTIMHVSSTDPWHRESDRDKDIEQVGFDRLYQTGLTNDLPMLVPTGLLYDTPENAANEIRYLRARGYKFDQVELGEEPDGQYITPEDFGALYIEFADAIHRVDPKLELGGPSFQEILPGHDPTYPIDNASWMRRFLSYLRQRNRLGDFNFFSFEWYPYDDVCAPAAPQLAGHQRMFHEALRTLEQRGTVPRNIPWIISEYGYSAYASRTEISIEGALMHADIVGEFLRFGGDQTFLYGYAPDDVIQERDCTWGNNMLFEMDDRGKITHRFATYFAARLMTQEWLKPGAEPHELYAANSDIKDTRGNELVTIYAVHRPDDLWSLLIINKDPKRSFNPNLILRNGERVKGPIDLFQYSEAQYLLSGSMQNPFPLRNKEPAHRVLKTGAELNDISLPPYSITVIRAPVSR
jgi:hypothetical protein